MTIAVPRKTSEGRFASPNRSVRRWRRSAPGRTGRSGRREIYPKAGVPREVTADGFLRNQPAGRHQTEAIGSRSRTSFSAGVRRPPVVGRVVDREGKGVAGAPVFQRDSPTRTEATTDARADSGSPGSRAVRPCCSPRRPASGSAARSSGRRCDGGHPAGPSGGAAAVDPEVAAPAAAPGRRASDGAGVDRAADRCRAGPLARTHWAVRLPRPGPGRSRARPGDAGKPGVDRAGEGPHARSRSGSSRTIRPRRSPRSRPTANPAARTECSSRSPTRRRARARGRLRAVDRALAEARRVDDKETRLSSLGQVADRWLDLGRSTARSRSSARGRRSWRTLPQDRYSFAAEDFAEVLAVIDLPPARAIFERKGPTNVRRPTPSSSNDSSREAAVRLAAIDPAEAERSLSGPAPNFRNRMSYLLRICRRMARADLPRAGRSSTRSTVPRPRSSPAEHSSPTGSA